MSFKLFNPVKPFKRALVLSGTWSGLSSELYFLTSDGLSFVTVDGTYFGFEIPVWFYDASFWLKVQPDSIYTDEAKTTLAVDTDPAAACDDQTTNDIVVAQPTLAKRPTYRADVSGSYLLFDQVDDLISVTVPEPGFTGTAIFAYREFTYAAEVNLPAGVWNFTQYQPTNELVEIQIHSEKLGNSGRDQSIALAESKGAGSKNWATPTDVVNGFRNNTWLEYIYTQGWTTVNTTSFRGFLYGCSSLKEIDISNFDLTLTTDFDYFAINCTSLKTVGIGAAFNNTPCIKFTNAFSNCALGEQTVNDILVALVTAGRSNGTLGLGGGTNAAPTGEGATAKATLQARGWTVTTN